MEDFPLLIFPDPSLAERARRFGGGGKTRIPNPQIQSGRITPQFIRLQDALDQQRITLQGNAHGLQPEKALVIETIGSIEKFINSISKIDGLEWLGEFELDDIYPEFGFEDEEDPEKQLKGQLFLIMTDQRALEEIQNLFDSWKENPNVKFPRGLAPLKQAFTHLHTIRPWDAEDRIRDTGLFTNWQLRMQQGQDTVPFELELWFRRNADRRQQAFTHLQEILSDFGGEVVQQTVIPEISYHGLLGTLPIHRVPEIMGLEDVRLLKCEEIMYLRPIGQCTLTNLDDFTDTGDIEEDDGQNLPQGKPKVGLLDGLPLARHKLLDGRIIIDDPDDFANDYQAVERLHGTTMASLICHGDLNENGPSISRPIYVRPILKPKRGFDGLFWESIPEEVLPVDIIHRAVRRMFEVEAGEPPSADSVRVVNLSVCDLSRPFNRSMSAWARLIDWLSWKYNILFIISAGNHTHDIELQIPKDEFGTITDEVKERAIIEAIAADTRHRRLLAPAESLNALTLGASHSDASTGDPYSLLINPFKHTDIPSTISAHGPGYRRVIKPDLLFPGGRQFLTEKLGNNSKNAVLQTTRFTRPPGQLVASPGASGELTKTIHTRGTSNSTALATHWADHIYSVIERLRSSLEASLPEEYDPVLIKTLLIHGAEWASAGELYESILKNSANSRVFRDYVARFIGYGTTNVSKVLACTEQRATVLGIGMLDDGEGHEFVLPLPPSLSAKTEKRRLTITLSWISPVLSSRQKYRIAHLWFNPKYEIANTRICADHRAVQRGTVQHEVLEADEAVDFQDGDNIIIKVNCRADSGDIPEPIRYALAVTLEVAEGIDIPIYQEVRTRIRQRIPIQSGGQV